MSERETAREIKSRLENRLSVQQFAEKLDHELFGEFAPLRSTGSAHLGFWRDAKTCQMYAELAGASQCRLCSSERPDFELLLDGTIRQFEATEVDRPGRRRGDEFDSIVELKVAGKPTHTVDPEENWLTSALARVELDKACRRKASKRYKPNCGLVIYLNWSDYGFQHRQIVDVFEEATVAASTVFASVDILWSSELYQIWENGKAVARARI